MKLESYDWGVIYNIIGKLPNWFYISHYAGGKAWGANYRSDGINRKESHYIIQYTLSGEVIFKNKTREWRLNPGEGFICKANDPDISYFYPPNGKEEYQFIHFGLENCDKFCLDIIEAQGPIFHARPTHECFTEILSKWKDKHCVGFETIEFKDMITKTSKLFTILIDSKNILNSSSNTRLLYMATKYIQQNITKRILVSDLSKKLSITPEHLSRIIKKELNITPHYLINSLKIQLATQYISKGKMTIKEVACALGYENSNHLSRIFKQHKNCSPSTYRDNIFSNR